MSVKNFFTKEQQQAIVQSIVDAEKNTSGEIRVHIDSRCKNDALDCAVAVFKQLKMHKTELRNGVLIYIAVEDKKFAIIGDAGINSKVPTDFWVSIKTHMGLQFKENKFDIGIIEGIAMIGEKLKTFFPIQIDDENELSNEISFGV